MRINLEGEGDGDGGAKIVRSPSIGNGCLKWGSLVC